jgi:DNA polymerase I
MAGECDPFDLVFANRITRNLNEYRVFNDRVAALSQLTQEGVTVHPGETIRYVVLNHDARDPSRRVRVLELLEGNEQYDKKEYLKFLLRTGASLLRSFGYTEEKLREEVAKGAQIRID